MIQRIRQFFETDLWRAELRQMRGWRRAAMMACRVIAHLVVSFTRSLGGLRASGLTLVTLLALVPVLVLVLGIAKAFGADYGAMVQGILQRVAGGLPEGVRDAVEQIQTLVDSISFGALGTMGTLVLVWSAFALFSKVELAFNAVWRAKRRSWLRRLTDFAAMVVLVPPLVIGAFVLQGILATAEFGVGLREYAWLAWLWDAGLGFVPWVMLWIAFAAVYKLMPSARVRWIPAMMAGIVAGSGLIVIHGLYLKFQLGVAHNNAIYATLAALPLLLVYLQLVWTVILVGAEVSYAVQHIHDLRGAEQLPVANGAIRKRLAWHLLHHCGEGFRQGRSGCEIGELAASMDVPREWLDEVADALVEKGLLLRVAGNEDLMAPARPPEEISAAEAYAAADFTPAETFVDRVALPQDAEQRLRDAEAAASRVLSGRPF